MGGISQRVAAALLATATALMSTSIDKKSLSERDVCSMFITPAIHRAGWDPFAQIREEVSFTKGRIIVRGKLVTRGHARTRKREPGVSLEERGSEEGCGRSTHHSLN